MTREIRIFNRQRHWRVQTTLLRQITGTLLEQHLELASWELGIHLVRANAMAQLNARWLGHEGSTDVITFDHRAHPDEHLHGEIFISLDDASRQARIFHTHPSLELVRYIAHGVLHLRGYDDLDPSSRRRMKAVENRLVRRLAAFPAVQGLLKPPPDRATRTSDASRSAAEARASRRSSRLRTRHE